MPNHSINTAAYGGSDPTAARLVRLCRSLGILEHSLMRTEKDKMISGELYNPQDEQLVNDRQASRILSKKFNGSDPGKIEIRKDIFEKLVPNTGNDVSVEPPFHCDYGYNISMGDSVFMNFNCTILDVCQVIIGSRTLIGPGVQIYTASHPLNHAERSKGLEFGKPVKIGEDVWIGGGSIICPGVKIGNRVVIGAGSVVTNDIPDQVLAAGNPCKIIRNL